MSEASNLSPYVSIVVTSRNDNHGGNMLRQMQIFINGIIESCDRLQLPAELIIVEWNPPPSRPRLSAALTGIRVSEFCPIRIIEVPPAEHNRLQASDMLFMFQMMAKNVGIRRAQGEFILVTGIDQLFSEALFELLAKRALEPHTLYRLDRYDVPADVPLAAPLAEQLAYCQNHVLRIHTSEGIEEIEPAVVATPEEAVTEEVVTEEAVPEEVVPEEVVPAKPPWWNSALTALKPLLKPVRQVYRSVLPTQVKDAVLDRLSPELKQGLIDRGLLNVQIPTPPGEFEVEEIAVDEPTTLLPEPEPVPAPAPAPEDLFLETKGYPLLYTRNCGEFMLMAREDWFALRGYLELEMFSSHLAPLLCHAAHQAGIREKRLLDPVRAYHLEHGAGWIPEADRDMVLNARLGGLGIPYLSFQQFESLAQLMQQTKKPLLLNEENWGMADQTLAESRIAPATIP